MPPAGAVVVIQHSAIRIGHGRGPDRVGTAVRVSVLANRRRRRVHRP